MPRTRPSNRRLALGAGIAAVVVILLAAVLTLSRDEPRLEPAAAPATSTTGSTTAPAPPSSSTTAPATAAPAARMAALPARTSIVATTTATDGEIDVYGSATTDEVDRSLPVTGDWGQQQVFLVTAQDEDAGRVQVLLPVRPNGSSGWVDADEVALTSHDFQIQVSLSEYRMLVQRGDEVIVDTPVGIGTDDTPTVGGQFYTWVLVDPTNAGYGSYAFGLSGFSTLESFNGGDGRMAIHGDTKTSSFGRAVSHGCVRVPDDVVVDMVDEHQLPLGVPVTILA